MNGKTLIGIFFFLCMGVFFTTYFLISVWSGRNVDTVNTHIGESNPSVTVSPVVNLTPPVEDKEIQLVDCKADPETIKVALNSSVYMKNTDDKEHTIRINDAYVFTIFSQERSAVLMNFDNQLGEIPFTCDGEASGILQISANGEVPY